MRPKLQKRSALKFAGRIIPGAKRRGTSREMNSWITPCNASSLSFSTGIICIDILICASQNSEFVHRLQIKKDAVWILLLPMIYSKYEVLYFKIILAVKCEMGLK